MTLLKQIFHVRAQQFNRNHPEEEQAQADTASISSKDLSLVDNDGRKRPAERSPSPEHTHLSKQSKAAVGEESLSTMEYLHQASKDGPRSRRPPLPTNGGLLDKHSTVKPVAAAAAKPKKGLKERYPLDFEELRDLDFSEKVPLVVASKPRRKQHCFVDSGDDEPSAAPDTPPHASLIKTFLRVTAEYRPERGPIHVSYAPSEDTTGLFNRLVTESRIPGEMVERVNELTATFTWTGERLRIRKAVEADLGIFKDSIVRAWEEDCARFNNGCKVELHLHVDE